MSRNPPTGPPKPQPARRTPPPILTLPPPPAPLPSLSPEVLASPGRLAEIVTAFRFDRMLRSVLLRGHMRLLPARYLVTALPTTGQTGESLFATDGRKSGEGSAAGTGVPVIWMTPAGGGVEVWCRAGDYSEVVA